MVFGLNVVTYAIPYAGRGRSGLLIISQLEIFGGFAPPGIESGKLTSGSPTAGI